MPQTFKPLHVLGVKIALLTIAGALLTLAFVAIAWSPRGEPAVNAVHAQPIPFSHKHHVGDVGLDCRFCHATVESIATPGMPSAQVCLTCHSQLFADQTLLAPLRQAVATHQPIAWTQLDRLPDYVYFDHSIHVAKGVACVECHGRVDQMPLISRPQEMNMKWCIACHENPGRHLRPSTAVFASPPNPLSTDEATQRAQLRNLEPRRRLTDCSTCHR